MLDTTAVKSNDLSKEATVAKSYSRASRHRAASLWKRSPIGTLLQRVITELTCDASSKLKTLAAAESAFIEYMVDGGGNRSNLHPVIFLLEMFDLRALRIGLGNATISGITPKGETFSVTVPRARPQQQQQRAD